MNSRSPMFSYLQRLILRLRYPGSCPEDLASALGIQLSNQLSFDELVAKLAYGSYHCGKLKKYMTRKEAEACFQNAQRIEHFPHTTLVSYYFTQGWMEFNMQFDENNHLRRLYIQHKYIQQPQGIEIQLSPGIR